MLWYLVQIIPPPVHPLHWAGHLAAALWMHLERQGPLGILWRHHFPTAPTVFLPMCPSWEHPLVSSWRKAFWVRTQKVTMILTTLDFPKFYHIIFLSKKKWCFLPTLCIQKQIVMFRCEYLFHILDESWLFMSPKVSHERFPWECFGSKTWKLFGFCCLAILGANLNYGAL